MLVKCERCGAPLEVPAGSAVRCPYCGTTTAAAAAPQPPPQPRAPLPGYGYGQGASAAYPGRVVPKRSFFLPILIGVVSVVAAFSGVIASILPQLTGSSSPALQALSNATNAGHILSGTSWGGVAPGCLIDANGDGVFDVAGLTGSTLPDAATVVDGKSGQVLFTAPAVAKAEQLACLGVDGFFVVQGNFQVDFYTARSPWGATHVMARDKVSEYGAGPGCAQLKTDDGSTQGIQLPNGVATTCAASSMHPYYRESGGGLKGLTDDGTELSVGARKYSLTQRASGTEILTVKVSEGSRVLWTKELPYASCTFGAAIAVAPGKIVLWAAHPGATDKGLIVGLDEATGNQLYEQPVPDSSSDNPQLFKFNGKYVLAVNWGALRAYDPATGAEVWRVGR